MASSGAVFSIVHEYYAMQSFTDGKIELTSAFSLLHHAHSFIFPFIHSFIDASVRHSFYNPCTLYFIHLVIHSSTHHLQALFVRRFFSCSCLLKPRWKVTPLTPDLSFVSSSRPVQKLLNLTPVHGVTPAATVMLNSPCALIIPSCAEKFEPSRPSYHLLTLCTLLTDWLNFPLLLIFSPHACHASAPQVNTPPSCWQ